MFCPIIKGECVGEECRDWDKEKQGCIVTTERGMPQFMQMYQEFLASYKQEQKAVVEFQNRVLAIQESFAESNKFHCLYNKLTLNRILTDPTIPDDIKETIRQAFEASSSEVAEKLLKDAGLID